MAFLPGGCAYCWTPRGRSRQPIIVLCCCDVLAGGINPTANEKVLSGLSDKSVLKNLLYDQLHSLNFTPIHLAPPHSPLSLFIVPMSDLHSLLLKSEQNRDREGPPADFILIYFDAPATLIPRRFSPWSTLACIKPLSRHNAVCGVDFLWGYCPLARPVTCWPPARRRSDFWCPGTGAQGLLFRFVFRSHLSCLLKPSGCIQNTLVYAFCVCGAAALYFGCCRVEFSLRHLYHWISLSIIFRSLFVFLSKWFFHRLGYAWWL